ncbi:MAG: SH3 domain-containing protein [Wolinella sp.]
MLRVLLFALLLALTSGAQEPILFPETEKNSIDSRLGSEELPARESPQKTPTELHIYPLTKESEYPKSVYLNLADFPARTLYIHEVIPATYRLLLLSPHQSFSTDFVGIDGSVEVLNKNSKWKKESDGSLSNTFYFKIIKNSFRIPAVRVVAQIDGYQDSDESEGRTGEAIALEGNALFSNVIAKELSLTDYKITTYDNENNLVVFRIQAEESNLGDFHLSTYDRQGIESSSFTPLQSSMIYYIILPRHDKLIEFDYFSTREYQYRRISLQNIVSDEKVSTQSDIKPKNTLRKFGLLLLGVGFLISLALYFYRRHIFYLLVAVGFLGYLIYSYSFKNMGYLKAGAQVKILPTYNSTVILSPAIRTKVEILGTRHGYYKVLSSDEKIGWVKKEEIEKN